MHLGFPASCDLPRRENILSNQKQQLAGPMRVQPPPTLCLCSGGGLDEEEDGTPATHRGGEGRGGGILQSSLQALQVGSAVSLGRPASQMSP